MLDQPVLPILSEEELGDMFSGDAGALRRYRLLRALLVEGMTQRDAAQRSGVSERTVRNVLRSYMRSGRIESLRSRQGGRRRRVDRQRSAQVQALTAALAEGPQDGGDRLWRRAQELLGDAGAHLSRRTAYRILASLRASGGRSEDDLGGVVRAALPLMVEDPPLALGASQLAQLLIPDEDDALLRGTLLQQALRAALDRLRPAGEVTAIDRSWWPYLICTGEYETGQSRAALQEALALSPSTYTRAKRQGIDRLAAVLPQIIAQLVETPAAGSARRLPRIPDFIGRREEQSYYAWRLQTDGRAYLWGLPGSGKTALAAELAAEGQRYGQTVIWHTCAAGRDATLLGILRGLAQALAACGDARLWQALRQAPAEKQNLDALLELLQEQLKHHASVVVIDDAHRADAEETAPLFKLIDELVARGATRLLLVGRVRPAEDDWPPLPGLSEREARLLWANAPALPADQWSALYSFTGGLPQPLRQVAAAYRRAGGLARPADWAAEVAAWAQEAIWNQLGRHEQRVLAAVHGLEKHAASFAPAALCLALGLPLTALEHVRRRGLLVPGDEARLLPMLRSGAAALLRADGELREAVGTLAMSLDTGLATLSLPADSPPPERIAAPVSATPPVGLDLIVRLSDALARSSAYLQQRRRDRVARLIASELDQLQAALPNLAGPGEQRLGR